MAAIATVLRSFVALVVEDEHLWVACDAVGRAQARSLLVTDGRCHQRPFSVCVISNQLLHRRLHVDAVVSPAGRVLQESPCPPFFSGALKAIKACLPSEPAMAIPDLQIQAEEFHLDPIKLSIYYLDKT